jgi:iron complex outermembrane recepter protein
MGESVMRPSAGPVLLQPNRHFRSWLIAGASLLALVAEPAAAQTAANASRDAENQPDSEVVIVTAERRETRLQETPLAVTSLSGAALKAQQIESPLDLQFSIPNTLIAASTAVTIRGVGRALTGEQGVATYVNGVYTAPLLGNEFYDLQRIEVLRGPQGTLYGRNATAGLVNVQTRRAGEEFSAEGSIMVGNFNSRRFEAAVDVPLGPVRQRFAGYKQDRDGFIKNLYTGNQIDGRDQYAVRSTTEFEVGGVEVKLYASYFEEEDDRAFLTKSLCTSNRALGCSPASLTTGAPDSRATVFHTFYAALGLLPAPTADFYAGAVNPTDLREVSVDVNPYYFASEKNITLNLSRDFGALKLAYVYANTRTQFRYQQDYDNVTTDVRLTRPVTYTLDGDNTITSDRIQIANRFDSRGTMETHELSLASALQGALNFNVGLYWLDADTPSRQRVFNSSLAARGQALGLPASVSVSDVDTISRPTKSQAAFGQVYYQFTERAKLTLGARYTIDEVGSESRSVLLSNPAYVKRQTEFKVWTGRASFDYKIPVPFTDASLGYLSWSRGYKAGGFNPVNATNPNPTFEPEFVDALELGLKNTLWGGRAQANVTLFQYDYQNLQLTQRIAASSVTTNSNADILGAEFEFFARLSDRLRIDANVSLLDTEVLGFSSVDAANPAQSTAVAAPVVVVNLSGNRLPYSPEWSYKLGAQYRMDGIGGWSALARLDYFQQDAFFAREYNTSNDRLPGWSQMNLKVSFSKPDVPLEIELFVKNLEDKDNITGLTVQDSLVGRFRNATIMDPRTFGIILSGRF